MPDTRPGLKFKNGICSACINYEKQKDTNWEKRLDELKILCDKYRGCNGYGYDCAIAISGGKDSHFQVYYMKEVMKMNPVLLSAGNIDSTETGKENLENYYKRLYQDDFIGFQKTKENLIKINKHCKINKINCYLVNMPDIHKLNPYKLEFINNKMRNFTESIDLKYFDLLEIFQSEDEKKFWNKYNDPHPNQYAHNLIAMDIFEKLNK